MALNYVRRRRIVKDILVVMRLGLRPIDVYREYLPETIAGAFRVDTRFFDGRISVTDKIIGKYDFY